MVCPARCTAGASGYRAALSARIVATLRVANPSPWMARSVRVVITCVLSTLKAAGEAVTLWSVDEQMDGLRDERGTFAAVDLHGVLEARAHAAVRLAGFDELCARSYVCSAGHR